MRPETRIKAGGGTGDAMEFPQVSFTIVSSR